KLKLKLELKRKSKSSPKIWSVRLAYRGEPAIGKGDVRAGKFKFEFEFKCKFLDSGLTTINKVLNI
ncbi:MAG: hypothetical protein AAF664_17250, partial [Planctomycetota bacterium]